MNSLQQLLDIYIAHPCRTLPNAFWKTVAGWSEADLQVASDSAGVISSLALWDSQRLMAFWCADPLYHPLTPEQIAQTSFALVHADSLPVFSARDFSHRQAYFRLVNEGNPGVYPFPDRFTLKEVHPQEEVHAVVNLIRACYESIKINTEIVHSWLKHPVYDPHLWVWVVDKESGAKAGLGIAERDPQVPEASLEWIQVHPAYQNKGLGKALVSELTRRALSGVKFVTVSGEVNNVSQPELLYRRCGFTGNDVWWLMHNDN